MKKELKIALIPRGDYCYHGSRGCDNYEPCPFYTRRKTNFGFKGLKKEPTGYCKYLNAFLDIDDQVKDCGINKDSNEDDEKVLDNYLALWYTVLRGGNDE